MEPVKTLSVLGEQIDVMVSSQMSNGALAFIVQTTLPGGGPPPHQHSREDETFTVLEGEFKLLENGKWRSIPKGEYAFLPRGTVHTFRNVGTTPGKIGVFITPGGFEEFFEQIESIPSDNMRKILEIGGHFGLVFHL